MSGKPRNVDQMREELFKVSLSQPVDVAVQVYYVYICNNICMYIICNKNVERAYIHIYIYISASTNSWCWLQQDKRMLIYIYIYIYIYKMTSFLCARTGAPQRSGRRVLRV